MIKSTDQALEVLDHAMKENSRGIQQVLSIYFSRIRDFLSGKSQRKIYLRAIGVTTVLAGVLIARKARGSHGGRYG